MMRQARQAVLEYADRDARHPYRRPGPLAPDRKPQSHSQSQYIDFERRYRSEWEKYRNGKMTPMKSASKSSRPQINPAA
jgi:hypothetical protein